MLDDMVEQRIKYGLCQQECGVPVRMLGAIWEDKAQERTQSMQCIITGSKNNMDQKRSEKAKIT